MQTTVQLKNRLLPAFVLLVLVMQLIDPTPIWQMLLVLFGGALLVSAWWAYSLAKSLSVERSTRFGWAQVGDSLEERFELSNIFSLPALWLEVRDGSDLPGHQGSRVTGIGGNVQNEWRIASRCARRGIYNLGPTTLLTSDPLGLFLVQVTNPAQRTIMVMPPILALPSIQVAPGGRSGDGRPRQDAPDRTVSASTVREYAPGDSLRWVHWPTSARRQKYFVRIFDGTPAGDWRILLDLNRKIQIGDGWDSTEEHSIILAASLADQAIRAKRPIGLTINGDPFQWLPARADESHRWELLRQLTIAKTGGLPLGDVLQRLDDKLPNRSSLIVITCDVRGEWLPALLALTWRGIKPTILLLDAATFVGDTDTDGYGSLPNSEAAKRLASELARYSLPHYVIPRSLLDRQEARPGQAGRWDWRISPRGRAIAVNPPQDLQWTKLG